MKGGLLVLSGPSGVGKDTILNLIPTMLKTGCSRVRTVTTRAADSGRDPSYECVDDPELDRRLATGRWIVTSQHSGRYATSVDEIEQAIQEGLLCLHSVLPNREGIGSIRKHFGLQLLSVALIPPGRDASEQRKHLQDRLASRQRPGDDIRRRLQASREILEYILSVPMIETSGDGELPVFDALIVNKDCNECAREVSDLVARRLLYSVPKWA